MARPKSNEELMKHLEKYYEIARQNHAKASAREDHQSAMIYKEYRDCLLEGLVILERINNKDKKHPHSIIDDPKGYEPC